MDYLINLEACVQVPAVPKTASALRVVLVDDSSAFLDALEAFLAEDARLCVVGRALTGREADELIAQRKPEVVLLDLSLPDGNGLDAAQAMKRRSDPPHVIIMTINEGPEYAEAARAAGADAFLTKSDIGQGLPPLIERLCRERGIGTHP